jgi:hypothetical protein
VQTWLQKRRKKKKRKRKRKILQTVFVRAIEAFEDKQGICMHAKCQPDE